jgi:UDP-3-O-[3-hydroxymyristoyl] N-acetylglucosamine deacetylase
MKKLFERQQRTLARSAEVRGIGFLTGQLVTLRFRPAPASTGVVFVRTDLGPAATIRARVGEVTGTQRRTTLGRAPLCVGLVEHVLAALAGLRIDNCFIDLDAPEPPGLDGSARQFTDALNQAGICLLSARRTVWTVKETVVVRQQGATLALHPADFVEHSAAPLDPTGEGMRVSYLLDYGPGSPIHRQLHTRTVTPAGFVSGLAGCRTFLLEEEARAFRQQGLGTRTRMNDLLVFGPTGPIDNTLRFADEPARHKILDIVGDLSLLGQDLRGHVVAYRSGHPLNIELVRVLEKKLAHLRPRQSCAA